MRYPILIVFIFLCFLSVSKTNAQDIEQIGKGKAFRFSGMMNIQGGPYIYSGAGDPRNEPFWWQLTGSPTISIYGWQIPFSFNYGSRSRSFNQPFNRYGLSPYYKWLTLHGGYRSIRMNPYVMSGVQFLGAGVEMNPKGFRFAAFYGRFSKPIAQDTNSSVTEIPAYKRMGYGAKIGVGNRRSYLDISLVKVYDVLGSTTIQDTNSIKPQDNIALGISSRLAITKRITFHFDVGASLLNRDLNQAIIDTAQSINPLPGFFQPRVGIQLLTAGNAALAYTHKFFGLKLQVKQVDPDYRALAAFYQQSDIRSITVEPSIRLKKNKVRLSGSIGRQQDNITGRKAFTSVRTIGSANIVLQPTKSYNLNLNYSNYGLAQQAGLQVVNDTFRIAQNNRSISLGQNYTKSDKVRSITFSMNCTYQELQDLNRFGTYAAGENQVWFVNATMNRVRLRDNLGFQGGINLSNNNFSTGSYLLVGPSLGVSKPFLKDKLQTNLNINYNKGFQAGKSSGSTLNSYASLAYQINKSHQLNLTINALHNSTPFVSPTSGTFTEIRFLAGYTLILQPKS
ncbi:MAG: hypothetical protein ACK5CY_00650 [Bacteroidia bacterium]|jgi:hypothetical protein